MSQTSKAAMEPGFSDCNCCDVVADPPLDNRPGLPALSYRVGTYATFLQRLQAALPRQAIADGANQGQRPLAALTTRAGDDAANALLDAAAVTFDILAFYNERILNEGYLRTATERRSVLELARAIGYELSPGVAASTRLAFTLEEPLPTPVPIPTPSAITIPVGTKVQSIPGPNQLPQTFETIEAITAKRSWNAMRPFAAARQNLQVGSGGLLQRLDARDGTARTATSLTLAGTATNLKAGDLLVVRVAAANRLRSDDDPISAAATTGVAVVTVAAVTTDFTAGRTQVDLVATSSGEPPEFSLAPAPTSGVVDTAPVALTTEAVRDLLIGQTWDERDLAAMIAVQRWDGDTLLALVDGIRAADPPPADVFAFRARSGVFGSTAPPSKQIRATVLDAANNPIWPEWDSSSPPTVWQDSAKSAYTTADLFLEQIVQGVAAGGWAILAHAGTPHTPAILDDVVEASLADFALSGKATGLKLKKPDGTAFTKSTAFKFRGTTVYFQSEALTPAALPLQEPLWDAATGGGATSVLLDRMVLGLAVGQSVAVSGTIAATDESSSGVAASEVATLLLITHSRGCTTLTFEDPLAHPYVRATVTINANLAAATHGETVTAELLGSGDGTAVNPVFTLKKPPLTYVTAATPSGGASTLTVRVNGVAWSEQPSLYGLAPDDRAYTLRSDDDGRTSVYFGDGVSGARLPSGDNNLVASYRSGLGPDGEVDASTLSILMSRPLGLKAAINPLAATGSAPPETLATARDNAPLTVRTLDRVVSLADFADFARAFAGIGKVAATLLWSGERRIVHLTVASATGEEVADDSALHTSLVDAIAAASDGLQPVTLQTFQPRFFKLDATLTVDPAYEMAAVVDAATAAITGGFAFATRAFAQPVTAAEVMDVIQDLDGVVAVKLNYLHDADQAPGLEGFVPSRPARWLAGAQVAADLLLIHPVGIVLAGVRP